MLLQTILRAMPFARVWLSSTSALYVGLRGVSIISTVSTTLHLEHAYTHR